MRIVGGMALPRGVQLESDTYSVRATYREDGRLTTAVREKTATEKWLAASRYIPKVVRLFGIIIMKFSLFGRLLFLTIVLLPIALAVLFPTESASDVSDNGMWYISVLMNLIAIGAFVVIIRTMSGFHAAEHMAIHAYEKLGVDGIFHIPEQPQFHPRCGGRILAPVLIGTLISYFIAPYVPPLVGVVMPFIILECVLWVDALIGWYAIPPANAASRLLQEYVTTRQPNNRELAAGQAALRALLKAHGILPTIPL
jgi:uncharacterized protein YqhQ